MKKNHKTVLSIFMCTIFSALTLFTATAVLPRNIKAQVDAFYQQYRQFALGRPLNIKGLHEWKCRVFRYTCLFDNILPNKRLAPEIILYLASRIRGNPEMQSIEVVSCELLYCPNEEIAGSIIFNFVTPLEQLKWIII